MKIEEKGRGIAVRLDEALANVSDRESFLTFVRILVEDWEDEVVKQRVQPSNPYGPEADGWEHGTIGAYLDAALRCAEDTAQLHGWQDTKPSWQAFAEFLYKGKYYE